MSRQLAEDAGELVAVVLSERGEQVLAVRLGGLPDVREALPPGGGDVQGVVAPVVGVAAALEEPVALELVDERDELAGQQPELDRQGLLGASRGAGDGPEQSSVRRGELQRCEVLGEAQPRQAADLGQQERHPSSNRRPVSILHSRNASSPKCFVVRTVHD